MAATGSPMFRPAAVFSGTLRAPVSLAGNAGASFTSSTVMVTVIWSETPDVSAAVTVTL